MISDLTEEELVIYMWKTDRLGGFKEALFDAIGHADSINLVRLERGFPLEVGAYRRFSEETGWWEKVQEKVDAKPDEQRR